MSILTEQQKIDLRKSVKVDYSKPWSHTHSATRTP